jgi:hypothetical protein
VIANSLFNRPAWRSISLHKRQVDPRDTFVEAFDFGYKHSNVERLIVKLYETGRTLQRYTLALANARKTGPRGFTIEASLCNSMTL